MNKLNKGTMDRFASEVLCSPCKDTSWFSERITDTIDFTLSTVNVKVKKLRLTPRCLAGQL